MFAHLRDRGAGALSDLLKLDGDAPHLARGYANSPDTVAQILVEASELAWADSPRRPSAANDWPTRAKTEKRTDRRNNGSAVKATARMGVAVVAVEQMTAMTNGKAYFANPSSSP